MYYKTFFRILLALGLSFSASLCAEAQTTYRLGVNIWVGHDDLREGSEIDLVLHFREGPTTTIQANFVAGQNRFAGIKSYGVISNPLPAPVDGVKEITSVDAILVQHSCFGCNSDNVDINKIMIGYSSFSPEPSGSVKIDLVAWYCFYPNFSGDDGGNQVPGRLKDGHGYDHGNFTRGNCNAQ